MPLLAAAPDSSVVFTGETHGAEPKAFWGGFAVSKAALSPMATIWADGAQHASRACLGSAGGARGRDRDRAAARQLGGRLEPRGPLLAIDLVVLRHPRSCPPAEATRCARCCGEGGNLMNDRSFGHDWAIAPNGATRLY
jgi:hypothetical protein